MSEAQDLTALAAAVQKAAVEVAEAQRVHETASRHEIEARSRTTEATNRLNRAQAAFDAAVTALQKAAPWNTDWRNKRQREAS